MGENGMPAYLLETEVAQFLRLDIKTIRNWRCAGKGPKFAKFSRSVRYKREDLLAWAAAAERASTSTTCPPEA